MKRNTNLTEASSIASDVKIMTPLNVIEGETIILEKARNVAECPVENPPGHLRRDYAAASALCPKVYTDEISRELFRSL